MISDKRKDLQKERRRQAMRYTAIGERLHRFKFQSSDAEFLKKELKRIEQQLIEIDKLLERTR